MAAGDTFTLSRGSLSVRQAAAIAAVMACEPCGGCGSGVGSGAGSGQAIYGLECCDVSDLYTGFCVTISGGSNYDGTYSLSYQTNQELTRDINPFTCAITTQTYGDGWFSDWQTDCRSSCVCGAASAPANRHRIWMPGDEDGVTTCSISHVTEYPFCAVAPAPSGCNGTLTYVSGLLFGPNMGTHLTMVACDPLVVTWENGLADCDCSGGSIALGIDAVLTEC